MNNQLLSYPIQDKLLEFGASYAALTPGRKERPASQDPKNFFMTVLPLQTLTSVPTQDAGR